MTASISSLSGPNCASSVLVSIAAVKQMSFGRWPIE
jgi:hypothetical protein